MNRFTRNVKQAFGIVATITALSAGLSNRAEAQVLITEDFSSGSGQTPPSGWTNTDNGATPNQIWDFGNPGGRTITGGTPGFSDPFAILDSDDYGNGNSQNSNLVTPAFDASVAGSYLLEFDNNWEECCGAVGTVEVWNGTTWTTVLTLPNNGDGDGNEDPSTHESINITTAVGSSAAAQVRFHYEGAWDYWWAIDNVTITRVSCSVPAATFTVVPNCTNSEFSVSVNITSLGSATSVAITEGATTFATATTPGTFTAGPFTSASSHVLTLVNDGNSLCNLVSGPQSYNCAMPNDNCSQAIALTPGETCVSTPGTNAGGTPSTPAPPAACVDYAAGNDVWYSFQATATSHIVSLSNIVATDASAAYYECGIVVYSGSCGSLTPMRCTIGGFDGSQQIDANISLTGLTVGQTYYVRIWSDYAEDNIGDIISTDYTFDICVKSAPQGATCGNPLVVNASPYSFSGNTGNYGNFYLNAPGSGCGSTSSYLSGDDVVFSYTASATGTIDINLTNLGDTYAGMFVYNSCSDIGTSCAAGVVNGNSATDLAITGFNVTANTTYYIVVSTWASPQTVAFTLNINGTAPLPVEMSELRGALAKNRARLNWTTFSEQHNKGFVVQRSENGKDFNSIGFVASTAREGNSAQQLNYTFEDKNMITDAAYYRLLQTDIDGKTTISNVVRLSVKGDYGFMIQALPNPVSHMLKVLIHGGSPGATITLNDVTGRVVNSYKVTGAEMSIDMSVLSQGMYFIKYNDGMNARTVKINKQ